MCPNNPVGTVDLFMVTHHGLAQSNNDALVQGVRPRVALMQNGTRKGGAIPVFESLRKSPGFEDVWQLHWSYNAGIEHNAPGVFIANVDDRADDCRCADGAAGRRPRRTRRRSPVGAGAAGGAAGAPAARRRVALRRTAAGGCRAGNAAGRCTARQARRRPEHSLPFSGAGTVPPGRARRAARADPVRPGRRPWRWRWRRSGGAHAGLLHQGLSAGRRHVHRHQHAERLQQDLPEAGELDAEPRTKARRQEARERMRPCCLLPAPGPSGSLLHR